MKSIVNKPWGSYEVIYEGNKYTLKKLTVNSNCQLSLQSHDGRSEHWLVVEGKAEVILNEETYSLEENQHIFIPKGAKHRLANRGDKTLVVIEMWFGNKLEENDIKRYEDIYNRY